uniref:Uncharacterized protein n=1 Tax=Rhizophora mucronata TaxID=61149 RepID=A0A2P2JKS7_RHIMU
MCTFIGLLLLFCLQSLILLGVISMDYDFRNRAGSLYDPQVPSYRPATPSSTPTSHPMYGHSLYPRIGQPGHPIAAPLGGRHPSFHQASAPSASSSGLGIRVVLKPEYLITPPV